MVLHVALESCGLFFLIFLFYAAGAILERKIPIGITDPWQRHLFRICLGMVAWIYLIFALAALHLVYSVVFAILMGMCILFYLLMARPDRSFFWSDGARLSWRWSPAMLVFLASLGVVLAFLFVQSLEPRITADSQNYHLYVPQRYIQRHGFYYLHYKPISNWPLNFELLFLLAMMVKDYMLAHLVHFLAGTLTLLALYLMGREQEGRFAGSMAVFFFLMNEAVRWIYPVCYSDLAIALFFILAFWFVMKSLDEPEAEKRHLLTAGIFAGAMAGCKINSFVGGLVLGVVYLTARLRSGTFRRDFLRMMLYFGLPSFVLLLPWLIKSAWMTGNPVYPFLYDLLGGREWNDTLSRAFVEAHRNAGMGREPLDYLLLPFRVIWHGDYQFSRFYGIIDKSWVVLVPFSLLFGIRRPMVRRALFGGLLYFCAWALGTQQIRHLIPVLTLLSFAAAVTLAEMIKKIPRRQTGRFVQAILLLAAAGYLICVTNQDLTPYGSYEAGKKFLSRNKDEVGLDEFVNRELSANARILSPDSNYGLFFKPEVISPNLLGTPQITELLLSEPTANGVYRKLRAKHITHILLGRKVRKKDFPKNFWRLLDDKRRAREIFKNRKFLLFELLPPPPASPDANSTPTVQPAEPADPSAFDPSSARRRRG